MTSRQVLGAKHVSETLAEVFDFSSRLAVGETLSSASTAATVYSGTDASPSGIISGSSSISGGKVTQLVTAGTAGVVYELICSTVTSTGQTLQIAGYLAVTPDTQ